jgi:hypothetical protein
MIHRFESSFLSGVETKCIAGLAGIEQPKSIRRHSCGYRVAVP